MTAEDKSEFRVGWGRGVLVAKGRGKCVDCKLLDTSTREVFPGGTIRRGRCIPHPIQPNGKWDDDMCDIMQTTTTPELNEAGESVQAFTFSPRE
jgi:hypothetical protein